MASVSAPCPKCSATCPRTSRRRDLRQHCLSFSGSNPSHLAGSAQFASFQGPKRNPFPILKAQVHEASSDGLPSSSPLPSSKMETASSENKTSKVVEDAAYQSALTESSISLFMAEVSDLVKLVDSRDITELKLKQMDTELIIRKKEAFAPPPSAAPVVMMQPPQQAMFPPQPAMAPKPTPTSATPSAPAPALPSPSKGSTSSLPALKCPMAGTFYRAPAPGEPPFVKVGDKVQKGQVVCLIEAMKLMNEIEADKSGTVVEIIAEDGKPVSVDMPLLVIQP